MHKFWSKLGNKMFAQPINRLLVFCFVVVAIAPFPFLAMQLYQLAWEQQWDEINEKHRLLAMNLAAPLSIYVEDHRSALGLVAATLSEFELHPNKESLRDTLLKAAGAYLEDFRSLTLVTAEGKAIFSTEGDPVTLSSPFLLQDEGCFIKTRNTGSWAISGIKYSPFDNKPSIFLSQPVTSDTGVLNMVLLGELRLDMIEELRLSIQFGERGHSAIVDQFGKVIAHPNAEWAESMRDLSHLGVVKKMMSGQTGVTEFYSPFVKQDMVAGYTSVADLGWGIMVPQPKAEVERVVRRLVNTQLVWLALGLLLAVLLGVMLARWITRPIQRLAGAAVKLADVDYKGQLPEVSFHEPREVRDLNSAIQQMVQGLRSSYREIDKFNQQLHQKVEQATQDLLTANKMLEQQARMDYLTKLANRRYFELSLSKSLLQRRQEDQGLCLILIDVDHFKRINDKYGHAAGDTILTQLASTLSRVTREGDLVARYGGDEFVVKMTCDYPTAKTRADDILQATKAADFHWGQEVIRITLSIGLVYLPLGEVSQVDELLREVDMAMYQAKDQGRDRLVELKLSA